MKNHKRYFGILSMLLGILLWGGCSNLFGPENSGPEGTGEQRVTFLINAQARTLLPGAPGFDKYSLAFTANDGQALPEENPVEIDGNSETILLAPGSWTVTVRGLIHFENVPGIADGYYEGAVSEPETFNVGFTGSNTVSVTIRGGIQSGIKGLLSYAVSFPAEVISGELRLLDLDEQAITGLDPVDLLPPANRSGTLALNPGYYLLQVELENALGSYAYKTDILHIYSGLTTTADSSNGYAFTAEQFAPITELSGQVTLTAAMLDNAGTCTLSFYRDSGYAHLIGSTELGGDGSWSFRISSYYTSVYLKAHIYYTGYPLLELTKGPVAVASTNPADWTIDAGLLELSGTVQLDAVVTIESNTTPALSLYSDSAYADLIGTVNVNTTTGAWNAVILPGYTSVYLKAAVDYDGFNAFDWKKGPVAVASTNPADWTIDAGLLELSGTVQLDAVVTTDNTPTLSLYSDSVYADIIGTANVNTTSGAWNAVILPGYTSVYLKATVDYTGFDAFDWKKGPMAAASTNPADWIIDAGLLRLSGTVQLDTIGIDTTPALSLYSDSEYATLIETMVVDTSTGAWNLTLLPEYANAYLKATVDYTGYDAFDWKKGPVTVTSTATVDWEIDTRLPRVTGTLPFVLTNDVPGLPILTVKVYSDAGYTTTIQHGGSDLSAPVTASFGDPGGDFEMIIPPSVSATNPPLYFKTHYSASIGLANPEDYTITGGTGIWTGSLSPGPNVLSLSALSIAGYCDLTVAVINDSYGDQTAYGSGSVTNYTNTSGGKYKGSVTVTATPNSGYVFVKWVAANDRTAPALSTNAIYTFTIQSDTTLYAVFNGTGTSTSVPAIEVWEAGTLSNGAYLTDSTDTATSGAFNGIRNGLNKHYKLIEDVTLTGTWTSTGAFTGTLDGNGKTITFGTGSSIAPVGTYAGILGSMTSGTVKNLTVAGTITITSTGKITSGGAIVGYLSSGTIQQCAVTGPVTSSASTYVSLGYEGGIGGIVGYMYFGTITASCVTGNVRATGGSDNEYVAVGGIVGFLEYGTVSHCYTTGAISGGRTSYSLDVAGGGVVGISYGTVEYCYAAGSVTAGAYNFAGAAGGIVGDNDGTVENCVALNSGISNGRDAIGRRIGWGGSFANNYGRNGLLSSVTSDPAGEHGATVNLANTQVQTWWFNSGGVFYSYDGTSVDKPWGWNAVDQRPSLYWEN